MEKGRTMTDDTLHSGVPRVLSERNKRRPTMGEIGLSQFAPYLINRIASRWNVNLVEALKEHNATTVRLRVLAVLSVSAGLTINELSVLAVTEQSTMSRTLDSMEEDGLILRQQLADDLRAKNVHLTEAGRAAFNNLWPVMYDQFKRMFDGVGDDEYQAFVSTLHKLLGNVRKHEI
jgi:MarR family transcriptional regulator for hemolysin